MLIFLLVSRHLFHILHGGPASKDAKVFPQPVPQGKDTLPGGERCGVEHPGAARDRNQGELSPYNDYSHSGTSITISS